MALKYTDKILPLRQQAEVRNRWLAERLDTVIPEVMAREGIDMWLVIAREYNEDPVVMSLLPAPAMAARRRTILVFSRQAGGTVERLTLSRYGMPGFYESGWNPDEEEQYECLARIIRERDPKRIGINASKTSAFGDGLSHTEHEQLAAAIGPYVEHLESGGKLCIGWLERRIDSELHVYPGIVAMGHEIIAHAFSSKVIQPGITTTDDVVWWMRQKMHDSGLQAWFQPSIEIQAPDQIVQSMGDKALKKAPPRTLILPGDLLHCDMGFYYLGLATDQQQHAYVLKPGESDAPAGLKAALAAGNRLQDIHMEEMVIGRTGNAVLKAALDRAKAEGLNPMIYSHPIGYHGHAAGPTIGLWDRQGGVPGNGDYPVYDNTAYSIELNVTHTVPEWGNQDVRIMLEEEAVIHNGQIRWLHGRQTEYHLIE